jgi:hypothetical protein
MAETSDHTVPGWTSAFRPYLEREFRVELQTPISFPSGRRIADVAAVCLRFPLWNGSPFVDDFGKKSAAMIELVGEHLFAELAVLRLLQADGWEGRWVNTYSGKGEVWKYLSEWTDVPRGAQRTRPIQDAEARQLLARIADFNRPRRYKGCWDVFAWRASQFAFVECKRTAPKYTDVVSKEQEEWLRSALFLGIPGLSIDSFCFVQWDYE